MLTINKLPNNTFLGCVWTISPILFVNFSIKLSLDIAFDFKDHFFKDIREGSIVQDKKNAHITPNAIPNAYPII